MNKTLRTALTIAAIQAAITASAAAQIAPAELRPIAEKAYVFAYPMVVMEYTRLANQERSGIGGAVTSPNQFTHAREFPTDKFRQVIRPNADTLYSSAWIDLSKEPVLMHVPATERYYLMQFMDAWTETFSVPGTRTTGTGEAWFAIVGPNWKGTLPQRATRIDSPTNMVWLIGRTQTNNATDYANVHAIQKGYLLMPLSLYPDGPPKRQPAAAARQTDPANTPPIRVSKLTVEEFFDTFARLLADNPPHSGDEPMMRELARAGIVPGKPFKLDALGAEGAKAFEDAAKAVSVRFANMDRREQPAGPNGWGTGAAKVGRYGTDYMARAVVARLGLGANPPEDATYFNAGRDGEGQPLTGENRYRLHFDKSQLPPVRAFWSVTMYAEDGYFVPNPIDRFAIGDRDPLKYNADGSLDLYIQREAPGGEKDRNWLPAPAGRYNLSLRLYWPKEAILNRTWSAPPVLREK